MIPHMIHIARVLLKIIGKNVKKFSVFFTGPKKAIKKTVSVCLKTETER